mmetsp:Transcript_28692/g.58707  ORF Transcript_28692/g.58707 Transcript_28692/m.58707 type:complete len:215 (+) Transcript_28692:2553-3197(+)
MHGPDGRRHERELRYRILFRTQIPAGAGPLQQQARGQRCTLAHSRGRHPKGRPFRRCHHDHRAPLPRPQHPRCPDSRHDGRGVPYGQGIACWRHQGEGLSGAARRRGEHRAAGGQPARLGGARGARARQQRRLLRHPLPRRVRDRLSQPEQEEEHMISAQCRRANLKPVSLARLVQPCLPHSSSDTRLAMRDLVRKCARLGPGGGGGPAMMQWQ